MTSQTAKVKRQNYKLKLKSYFISTSFACPKRSIKKKTALLCVLAEFKSLVYVGKLLAKARQTSHHLTSRLVKFGFTACSQRHFLKPFYAMLAKRIKLLLGFWKLRILSSFRFEALKKVQRYRLVSERKIFNCLTRLSREVLKIKTGSQAFSQRISAGRFGVTFSTKGDKLKRILVTFSKSNRVYLRLFASSNLPCRQAGKLPSPRQSKLSPQFEHALSKKLTKRISTNYLSEQSEFVVLLERLSFLQHAQLAAALVTPFRQKVSRKLNSLAYFATKGSKKVTRDYLQKVSKRLNNLIPNFAARRKYWVVN